MDSAASKHDPPALPARVNVAGVVPEARAIARRASTVYLEHLGRDLVTVVVHGSAVKGGYIPGCSDVDLRLYVATGGLDASGAIQLARAGRIYHDLRAIPLAPFRYLQAYAYEVGGENDQGFVPGAYCVVYGSQAVPLATAASLLDRAHDALRRLDPAAHEARISRELIEGRAGNLDREIRYLCTDVWPVLNHVLCVSGRDPLVVWRLTKRDAVALSDSETALGKMIRGFLEAATAHYARAGGENVTTGESGRVGTGLIALEAGLAFLRAASDWYHGRG